MAAAWEGGVVKQRKVNMPDNLVDLRERVRRDAATITMQANEIAMLRRRQGELREELEQFRDRTPSPAVLDPRNRSIGL